MPRPIIEVVEFTPASMRRIAEQVRRLEAQYYNLVQQLSSRNLHGDPKVPRTFLMEATETIPARTGATPGEGSAKVVRKVDGDIADYLPDESHEVIRTPNNFILGDGASLSLGDQFLAIEDAFGTLWALTGAISQGGSSYPQRLAYAYLDQELCRTGTGTGSGTSCGDDEFGEPGLESTSGVGISLIRYIDGTVPDPNSGMARNVFGKVAPAQSLVLVARVASSAPSGDTDTGTGTGTGTGTAEEEETFTWDIWEVIRRPKVFLTGWRYDPQTRQIKGQWTCVPSMWCGEDWETVLAETNPCVYTGTSQ